MRRHSMLASRTLLPRRRALRLRSFLAFATIAGAPLVAGAQGPVVPPGSLVRWPGEGITSCSVSGSPGAASWRALAGACWYPIDLLATGRLKIARRLSGRSESRGLEIAPYPYPIQELHVEESKVTLSPQDLARVEREQERVAHIWALGAPRSFSLPLAAPLDPLPAAGHFGDRRVFNGQPRSPHTGADFPALAGTPVRAAADGRVVLAEEQFFPGKAVFLLHGDALFTAYFHLSKVLVRPGQHVRRGDTIGEVGATGRVTGAHLHFAVRWHGAKIDPQLLLGPVEKVTEVH